MAKLTHKLYDGDTFTHNGREFTFKTEFDDSGDAPWERCEPLGDVTDWESRDKRPGEITLCTDRRSHRFYDFAGAMRKARKDGCKPSMDWKGPKGEGAALVVREEFRNFQDWCNDRWHYIGVIVTDVLTGETQSLWGIEDNSGDDYIREVAVELAWECIHIIESNRQKMDQQFMEWGIKVA